MNGRDVLFRHLHGEVASRRSLRPLVNLELAIQACAPPRDAWLLSSTIVEEKQVAFDLDNKSFSLQHLLGHNSDSAAKL
jgi:hypothetical protein